MRAIQVLPSSSGTEGGDQTLHIDLSNAQSKAAVIEAVRAGLRLPDYCGSNWDALEECLRDLKEGGGWLLVFENADGLLLLPTSELSTFLSVLSDTAEFWKDEGHSFRVALIGGPALAAAVEGVF